MRSASQDFVVPFGDFSDGQSPQGLMIAISANPKSLPLRGANGLSCARAMAAIMPRQFGIVPGKPRQYWLSGLYAQRFGHHIGIDENHSCAPVCGLRCARISASRSISVAQASPMRV